MDTPDNIKKSKRKRMPKQKSEKVMTSFGFDQIPIDLGLPSGTKWAPCNVGAFSPEEVGGASPLGKLRPRMFFPETTILSTKMSFSFAIAIKIGIRKGLSTLDSHHMTWQQSRRACGKIPQQSNSRNCRNTALSNMTDEAFGVPVTGTAIKFSSLHMDTGEKTMKKKYTVLMV